MNLENKNLPEKKIISNWRSIPEEFLNYTGWGGSPDEISNGKHPSKGEPKEYYYLKIIAKASAKSIEQNSFAMMMSTCYESAKTNGVYDIFSKFMDAVLLVYVPKKDLEEAVVSQSHTDDAHVFTLANGWELEVEGLGEPIKTPQTVRAKLLA